MSPRYVLLAAGSVAVLGLCVYLFFAVRSAPAASMGESRSHEPAHATQMAEADLAPHQDVTPNPATRTVQRNVAARRGEGETTASTGGASEPGETQPTRANPKFDEIMDLANKAYDEQDFDEARAIATKVLSKEPTNTRMLRVMVSSACIQGDKEVAQKYFDQLPKFDREQMKSRCDRYGIAFRDPPQ